MKLIYLILFVVYSQISFAQEVFPLLSGKYGIKEKRLLLQNKDLSPVRLIPLLIYFPIDNEGLPSNSLADYAPLPLLKSYNIDHDLKEMKKRAQLSSESDLFPFYPVIFFSPGLGIPSDFYTALLEEVASHGFIVVAFSHPYMSGNVYNPEDGSIIPMMDFPTDHQEVVALLQKLIDLNLEDFSYVKNYFSSIFNFKNFWVMGHSGGGMSATVYCSQKLSPCRGAINLDGGDYTGIGVEVSGSWPTNQKLPYLKIRSQSFPNLDHIPISAIAPNRFLVDVKGIDHSTFTDKAFFPNMILQGEFELINPHLAHAIIRNHILDFLRLTLGR